MFLMWKIKKLTHTFVANDFQRKYLPQNHLAMDSVMMAGFVETTHATYSQKPLARQIGIAPTMNVRVPTKAVPWLVSILTRSRCS